MTIEAACASLCNEPTFRDAVSATAPPPLLPFSVDMYYIPIKSIITLELKILIMSDVFDFLPLCSRYSAKRTVINRSHSSDRRGCALAMAAVGGIAACLVALL